MESIFGSHTVWRLQVLAEITRLNIHIYTEGLMDNAIPGASTKHIYLIMLQKMIRTGSLATNLLQNCIDEQ